jgi:hypothetical protein
MAALPDRRQDGAWLIRLNHSKVRREKEKGGQAKNAKGKMAK